MTVPIPVTETTITTEWGTQVATDVNGLLSRATALEGINAGTRLTTAEGDIDALQANAAVIGARNGHTYNPGQVIASGGACQFDVENYRSGITAAEDYSGWTTVTAGVYAISWGVQLGESTFGTGLVIQTVQRAGSVRHSSNGWSYGSWGGFIPAGHLIKVIYVGGTTVTYLDAFIDIFRVAQGG